MKRNNSNNKTKNRGETMSKMGDDEMKIFSFFVFSLELFCIVSFVFFPSFFRGMEWTKNEY